MVGISIPFSAQATAIASDDQAAKWTYRKSMWASQRCGRRMWPMIDREPERWQIKFW